MRWTEANENSVLKTADRITKKKNLNECQSLIAALEAVFSVTSKNIELGPFVDVVEPCYLHRTIDHWECLSHFSLL